MSDTWKDVSGFHPDKFLKFNVFCATIIICILYMSVFADTETISDSIPENNSAGLNTGVSFNEGICYGEFTKEKGPFVFSGQIVVPSGKSLVFGPGSQISVAGDGSTTVIVYGKIILNGTAREPIVIRSAKKIPQSNDWNGIYCRSGELSEFTHTIISNSCYGVIVENGNVSISKSSFSNNSTSGLSVYNSELTINDVKLTGGHSVAIDLQSGARVSAVNLCITDNKSGILCRNGAMISLDGGEIAKNINGIIADKNASVKLTATKITSNKFGLVTNAEIPRRSREAVYGNFSNYTKTTDKKLSDYYKAQKNRILVPGVTVEKTAPDFTAGFSALNTKEETSSSFIGNVITGFSLYKPESYAHPADLDSVVKGNKTTYFHAKRKQTRYVGEHTDKWYGGIQPDLQVFLNGKRGPADINLMLDMYGNNWLSTSNYVHKNLFNLTMSYNHQMLVFGDFYEGGSETSISGRQITGMKYSGGFFDMGEEQKRVEFRLSAGETEVSKDSGDHELNIFNVKVDSGNAIRQQITYLAALDIKPISNATIGIKGIIARDQDSKPFLRKEIEDTSASAPVESQTGCINADLKLLDSKLEISGEFDLGSKDTIPEGKRNNIAWYNPQVEDAAPEVFGLFESDKIDKNYAGCAEVKANLPKSSITLGYKQIGKDYFSAGNPYLESDKRDALLIAERMISDIIQANAQISNERMSIHTSPIDRSELSLDAEYNSKKTGQYFSLSYTGRVELCDKTEYDSATSGTYNSIQFCNMAGFENRNAFKNGISYSFRYQILTDKDLSDHPVADNNGIGDRLQCVWNGTFGFKVKKFARNKTNLRLATKSDNRDSLHAISSRIADQLSIDIIRGKLQLKLAGEYNWKKEKKFIDRWLSPCRTKMYRAESEVRYSITPALSASINGGYEKSFDEISGSTDNYKVGFGGFHITGLF